MQQCPNCRQPAESKSPERCTCKTCGEFVNENGEWRPAKGGSGGVVPGDPPGDLPGEPIEPAGGVSGGGPAADPPAKPAVAGPGHDDVGPGQSDKPENQLPPAQSPQGFGIEFIGWDGRS